MKFEDLEQVYRKWLYLDYEPNLLRLVVATYLSVQYKGIPLWMILIGSPGVGKSEMLMGLATCSKTVMMSKMSANALATAHRDAVPLLEQLKDNKIMVIKDMSTMTELPSEVRSAVFSDLRDSYDGRFVRYTGMGEYKWEGKFNIICGATPALERSRVHEASLGERFVQVRININADHERILQHRSFENALKITSMRKELAKATKEYLDKAIVGIHAPISVGTASRLHELAYMVAKARSDVPRNAYNREIESPSVSSEVPTRIASQIFILASALIEIKHADVTRAVVFPTHEGLSTCAEGEGARGHGCALQVHPQGDFLFSRQRFSGVAGGAGRLGRRRGLAVHRVFRDDVVLCIRVPKQKPFQGRK